MITYNKPGTVQYRSGTIEEAEFLKNFGWEPVEEPKPKKNAAKPEPTAEQREVADTKGE